MGECGRAAKRRPFQEGRHQNLRGWVEPEPLEPEIGISRVLKIISGLFKLVTSVFNRFINILTSLFSCAVVGIAGR